LSLIAVGKNLFFYPLPRHPLPEIKMNGVVKDSAENKIMVGKDRNAHDMPVSILEGAEIGRAHV